MTCNSQILASLNTRCYVGRAHTLMRDTVPIFLFLTVYFLLPVVVTWAPAIAHQDANMYFMASRNFTFKIAYLTDL